jgi:tRNA pseudouridine32 synthase/23S rRNA pseudouridine746 synthase
MDTSGIMIFALNKNTQRFLNMQFEKRMVKKFYEARVFGNIKKNNGSIDLPLIVDWPNRPLQKVDIQEGRDALTHWQVLNREKNVTRVELVPETGRTHQLRVHLMSLGHTILGDRFYGNIEEINLAKDLQLHSKQLEIIHPKNGKLHTFVSNVPF